jgi:hypothetical protein
MAGNLTAGPWRGRRGTGRQPQILIRLPVCMNRLSRVSQADATVGPMSAQPDGDPMGAPGRDLPYQLIKLGGETAAVVPLAELRRLRALERIASPDELAEAAAAARVEELDALEVAGQTGEMTDEEARRILGIPAGHRGERQVPADEVRRLLGMPR